MADERGIPERRVAFLETCFEVFCKNGLENTGLKMLAEACGVTNGPASTTWQQGQHRHRIHRPLHGKGGGRLHGESAHQLCGHRAIFTEDALSDRKAHGEKYRFMYQVYASPKYRAHGKAFFQGVNVRYHQYAVLLSGKLECRWILFRA